MGKGKRKGKKKNTEAVAMKSKKGVAVDAKAKEGGKAGHAKPGKGAAPPGQELSEKEYQRELRKLHVELVKLQEDPAAGPEDRRPVRGTRRRRQGRGHQDDHPEPQPARVPRCCACCAH